MSTERKNKNYTPVLGLLDDAQSSIPATISVAPAPTPRAVESSEDTTDQWPLELSVIIPARNEEASLGACLQSLVSQSEDFFALGTRWELIVVDDGSTDRTAEIARSCDGVTLINAAPLETGWTGKANAIWTAVKIARGKKLLFTDADTLHDRGNLRRAIHEAQKYKVGLLSYSPRQLIAGFAQSLLMPLVFSELAIAYPPAMVSDPDNRIAAANGQFLFFDRAAYNRIGGHAAVSGKILEDVELAFLAKRRGIGLRFRYAADALSTHMYRTTEQMIEGWSKNLALLFGNSRSLALWRVVDFLLLFGLPLLALEYWYRPIAPLANLPQFSAGLLIALLWIRTLARFYSRVRKSNFSWLDCLLTPLGLPLFIFLLGRSWWLHNVTKQVPWKGRNYLDS